MSQGSRAGIAPVPKISRYDEVTKKPIPNLFNKEVISALGTRGGALWERLVKEDHLRAADAGASNAEVSWSQAVKNTGAVSEDINYYNKKFGLEKCPVKITKTLLNKITEAIERTDDGDRKITQKEFVQSVVSAGLSHLTADQYATMFKNIDTDGSGEIEFTEWMEAIDPSFNEKFGLKDVSCTYLDADTGKEVTKQIHITKGLLNKITNALVWEKQDDGSEGISEAGFVQSCAKAALSQLKPEQYATMFKAIDTDGSGLLGKEEWTQAVAL
jgi:Ca2+-binding EF-hand superfamily protein